jgi:hypothetical protein
VTQWICSNAVEDFAFITNQLSSKPMSVLVRSQFYTRQRTLLYCGFIQFQEV